MTMSAISSKINSKFVLAAPATSRQDAMTGLAKIS